MIIGFIGQGFIGKAYANDFEERGYSVVRYAQEAPYSENKDAIADCDVVFIAVPTPTTPDGFSYAILREVLGLVGVGKVAVIKSTVLPGTTETLQKEFPDIFLIHSPEFLVAKTAHADAKKPLRNIVGYTEKSESKAEEVLALLPPAPYARCMPVRDAELVKYMGNVFLAQKVIFANLMYDVAQKMGINYDAVAEVVGADPRIGMSHLAVSENGKRGAGGFCFIKDLAAFSDFYEEHMSEDVPGTTIFKALEDKNIALLTATNKDPELLRGVYGDMQEKFRVPSTEFEAKSSEFLVPSSKVQS